MRKLILSILFLSLMGCTTVKYGDISYTRFGSQGSFSISKDGDSYTIDYGGVNISNKDIADAIVTLLNAGGK